MEYSTNKMERAQGARSPRAFTVGESNKPSNWFSSKGNGVVSSPPHSGPEVHGDHQSASAPTWAQVVQDRQQFRWEMLHPSEEDISTLEACFNDLIVFSKAELP